MSELKTLKDILELNGIDYECGDWGESLVDLKQEVIKRLRKLQKQHDEDDWVGIEQAYTGGKIDILEELFNITKEDLK